MSRRSDKEGEGVIGVGSASWCPKERSDSACVVRAPPPCGAGATGCVRPSTYGSMGVGGDAVRGLTVAA